MTHFGNVVAMCIKYNNKDVLMRYSFLFFALFTQTVLCADEPSVLPPPEQAFGQTFVMIAIALMFFYFILWRPENKRRKMMETKKSSMRKGDTVTVMGIIGHVAQIKEHTVVIRLIEGKMEVSKHAITDVQPAEEKE